MSLLVSAKDWQGELKTDAIMRPPHFVLRMCDTGDYLWSSSWNFDSDLLSWLEVGRQFQGLPPNSLCRNNHVPGFREPWWGFSQMLSTCDPSKVAIETWFCLETPKDLCSWLSVTVFNVKFATETLKIIGTTHTWWPSYCTKAWMSWKKLLCFEVYSKHRAW